LAKYGGGRRVFEPYDTICPAEAKDSKISNG